MPSPVRRAVFANAVTDAFPGAAASGNTTAPMNQRLPPDQNSPIEPIHLCDSTPTAAGGAAPSRSAADRRLRTSRSHGVLRPLWQTHRRGPGLRRCWMLRLDNPTDQEICNDRRHPQGQRCHRLQPVPNLTKTFEQFKMPGWT